MHVMDAARSVAVVDAFNAHSWMRSSGRTRCFLRLAWSQHTPTAAPNSHADDESLPNFASATATKHVGALALSTGSARLRSMTDEEQVARETARHPVADISPAEFEVFVTELLDSVSPLVEGFEVTPHERIAGADGEYEFDTTVRFRLAGLNFLVLVEAKRHKNPIKRELVQALHAKLQSVGAQKAAMIATAPYQRGALDYAKAHGIALATVTEGRFGFVTRSREVPPVMSRDEAASRYGLPTFVGHAYQAGGDPGTTSVTLLSVDDPEYVLETLLGVADQVQSRSQPESEESPGPFGALDPGPDQA